MKLNFKDRLKQDKNFAREVDIFQRELVFIAMGVDPEEVAAAWDGKKITKRPGEFVNRSNASSPAAVVIMPPAGPPPTLATVRPTAPTAPKK